MILLRAVVEESNVLRPRHPTQWTNKPITLAPFRTTTATRSLKKTTATARVVTEVDPRATPTPAQATAFINQKQLALMPAAYLLLSPVEPPPRRQKM